MKANTNFASPLRGAVAMAILGFGAALAAGSAAAALPNCTVSALSLLAVPQVNILSAFDVPASASHPEFCDATGTLTTTGERAPDGMAAFEIQMPAAWNEKFLFWGVGGTAGSTYPDFSANPVDLFQALFKGYATAITDEGHQGNGTDGAWSLLSKGVPDSAKVVDYYHRATHQVTVAAKQLVLGYYAAPAIKHAYFDGCANGGRQAMVEATRYPEDYDGIIAGAPFFDIRTIIAGAKIQKVQLSSPDAYIPAALLPVIDKAVYDSCDAVDGVKDGLIQNPAKCSFDPATLICTGGSTANCLTPQQAQTLSAYITALRDEHGRLIYPAASITDLHGGGMDVWTTGFVAPSDFTANEPWGGTGFAPAPVAWQFVDHILKFLVERDASFDLRTFAVSNAGIVDNGALAFFDSRTATGNGDDPAALLPYIFRDKKLLMFHGFSDQALPPFRTVKYYEDLARAHNRGYQELQENVRLFMVPGMQHCIGGPGPNSFDTLTALEKWAESGVAPDSILAVHYVNNQPALGIDRTMPLCKFPEEAEYSGSGDPNSSANWTCTNNRRLLQVGPNGRQAGLKGARDEPDAQDD
jgi:feruloyl esterase